MNENLKKLLEEASKNEELNERLLDGFEARCMHPEFNMSFDGVGHHDWLRGVDGAEQAVRRAFELCRERGFPTGAEMCLWKDNRDSLRESVNYLASVGCRSLKTNPVSDSGAWHEGGYAAEQGLSMEETFGIRRSPPRRQGLSVPRSWISASIWTSRRCWT